MECLLRKPYVVVSVMTELPYGTEAWALKKRDEP